MTPEDIRLRRRALMGGLEDPEAGATDPGEFEAIPGLMSGLMAQRPRPAPPRPSPVQRAAQPPPFDTGLEDPEAGATDPRAFESTIGGVGKMLPPITDQPTDELALAGLADATRTPATGPFSGRPADQLAPGETEPPDMAFSLTEAQGPGPGPGRASPVALAAQPGQSRQQARPQAQADQYDPGSAPTPLATFLRSLPNVAGNLVQAGVSGHSPSRIGGESIRRRAAQNREMFEQDEQARDEFDQRKQAMARLRSQDEIAAADRADVRQDRQEARQDRATIRKLSEAARDPNSDKNKVFRQAVERAYPEIREALGPNFDTLTIEDAHSIQPLVERGKVKAEAEAKEGVRLQKNKDREDYFLFRQRNKRPTVNVGLSMRGNPDELKASMDRTLGEAFGGEDKVPPEYRQQVALIRSMPAGKQPAAYTSMLSRLTDDKRAGAGQQARLEGQAERADFQERKEYEKASRTIHEAEGEFARSDKIFKDMGLDMDKFDGQNVPGFGRVESWLHTALQGEKGQQVRQRIKQHVASLARRMSGLAVTDTERENYMQIAGAAAGMSDKALIDGYVELKTASREASKRINRIYKNAARDYQAEIDAEKATPAQGVRIISPTTGKPATFKGTKEEAEAAGYKVL